MTKKVPKIPPSPSKTEVLHAKYCIFYSKKTTQPPKKLMFSIKNWQKIDQKAHPAPQKVKFCMKKIVFFYSHRPPRLPKHWIGAWKNDKKVPKKGTKKSIHSRKKLKFCMKNWKSSYLWGFWKKNSRPPTSPNY